MTSDPALPGLEDAPASGKPHYHGHRERLRERFLAEPEALPDYEVLELLLASVIPRRDTKPLAKALIDEFGGFAEVLAAPPQTLEAFSGISPTIAAYLKVVEHAAQRMARLKVMDKPVISSWDALLDYCNAVMGRLPVEQFRLLFLDRKNVLIADELQQQGTVDHTPLYPREVVKRALQLNSSAIIMAHNHPSGDPTPSKADIEMTRTVRDALRAVGIQLHDHLVIGRKGHVSFKSLGLL
ncbi:MAG TPA: DNA repair protein RadC [Magnetospirillum sp.]|nr:DNA repair protein RadC [Magnetospirillum sp.]